MAGASSNFRILYNKLLNMEKKKKWIKSKKGKKIYENSF